MIRDFRLLIVALIRLFCGQTWKFHIEIAYFSKANIRIFIYMIVSKLNK